jgi:hypothetical protein
MNSRFIIGGHFNTKHNHWDSRSIANKDRDLYKAVADTGFEIVLLAKQSIGPQIRKEFQI